ncbi:MAG: histidine phosphatase family protein [Thermoanaerobaculia bacterium]
MRRAVTLLLMLLFTSFAPASAAPTPPAAAARAGTPAPAPGNRTLYLVRHGKYDEHDVRDPRVGKGLVAMGVAQARLAGARLRGLPVVLDDFVASPFTRARQTAEIVGDELGGRAPRIDQDLAECTPPTRRADIMAGEKPEELAACTAQLERLAAKLFAPSRSGARHELIVAHGNVIRYLVTKALAVDPDAWLGMSIGHASLTVLVVEPAGAVRIVAVGDVGHLPPSFQTGAVGNGDRDLELP